MVKISCLSAVNEVYYIRIDDTCKLFVWSKSDYYRALKLLKELGHTHYYFRGYTERREELRRL